MTQTALLFLALSLALLASVGAKELQDACVCNCCYDKGGEQCVNPSATTFPTNSCSICNVTSCAAKFPRSCGLAAANISADCVERTAWYLRLIPVMFMVSTVALVFYGVFIKTFDGYHPIESRTRRADSDDSAVLTSLRTSANSYQATAPIPAPTPAAASPLERLQRHAVKVPSPLSQTAPLTAAPTTPTMLSGNMKPNSETKNVHKVQPLDTNQL